MEHFSLPDSVIDKKWEYFAGGATTIHLQAVW